MDSNPNPNPNVSSEQVTEVVTESHRWSQIATGLLLIGLGLLFFAERQGWAWGWGWRLSVSRLWPLVLIVVGFNTLIVRVERTVPGAISGAPTVTERRYRPGGGFVLVGVGVLMLLHVNGVLRLDQSWPLFVVLGGLSIMVSDGRRLRRRRGRRER